MAVAANFVNAEHISKTYGTRTLLDDLTIGLGPGDVIGVVGRNGDGKSTLLRLLTGREEPDTGRVTRTGGITIGIVDQSDEFEPTATVRDLIVDGAPDHVWAADATTRGIVEHLLADVDLDREVGRLSGGERRRVALVAAMLHRHEVLVLDEPTNHLDVEAVAWLAEHLRALQTADRAMLVVSHDRWFLDAICTRVWEVHDGTVDTYDGGYAAYVLARVERQRQAAANEARRQNLMRKELAWLQRGAPARTSKPKFRIDAANELIANEPPPRDALGLQKFAMTRLGKDVIDLSDVSYALPAAPDGTPGRPIVEHLTWSLAPGARIGLVGVNGAGKTTLLRLFAKDLAPDTGAVKHGKTLNLGWLNQNVEPVDPEDRVLTSMQRIANRLSLADGREVTTTSLLEDFGFSGNRLHTRLGELSGGERRRLQFLRIMLHEPNVLLLDEPTNDLDIDTLNVVEDYLDNWPGTLVVVSHDRYFLERTTDVTYALFGDGAVRMLPRGVDEYLERRRALQSAAAGAAEPGTGSGTAEAPEPQGPSPAETRRAQKDMARLEGQLARISEQIARLHADMASEASDYVRLGQLQTRLGELEQKHEALEEEWLEAASVLED
ncbi:ATPase components of ABC transporters with duplicated ATPase domains [Raineyella antarctica]|uniref:ATPase components of ABC transporters with duplicated ATPase domains n=1 Tax=Raineyella antarctica TaxID=1577474 RepID=A0A1G6GDM9_9ACTN|nr:ABC-F family ATP-binding cassette domain-containing protein [Raineyella antarctica]SDB80101.1 ATPase components of ABC transporters with duplicated ATPase domains [Raineyella antarctica]